MCVSRNSGSDDGGSYVVFMTCSGPARLRCVRPRLWVVSFGKIPPPLALVPAAAGREFLPLVVAIQSHADRPAMDKAPSFDTTGL